MLIKPKVGNPTTHLFLQNVAVGCYTTTKDAQTAADEACEKIRKELNIGYDVSKCANIVCQKNSACPDSSTTSKLTMNRSFLHRSEIEFITAQSTAKVKVKGETYTRPVRRAFPL